MLTRSWRRAVAFVASGLVLVGCGSSATDDASDATPPRASSSSVPTTLPSSTTIGVTTTTTARKEFGPDAFASTDALLEERVRSAGLSQGMIKIVAADGAVIHEHTVGGLSGTTPIAIASSTKWLTASTFMTFVDQGAIGLDDDIARWLPEFGGSDPGQRTHPNSGVSTRSRRFDELRCICPILDVWD